MFGDSNSSALQEQVLDLTDRMYNSWINWVRKTLRGIRSTTVLALLCPISMTCKKLCKSVRKITKIPVHGPHHIPK